MKLKADISGHEHALELDLSKGSFAVDDRHYALEVRELPGGEYLLLHGDTVYKCRVEAMNGSSAGTGSFAVSVRGKDYEVALIDPKRLRSGQAAAAHHAGAAEIVSPMPGKIVRVLVEAGANVEAGAGIIVVEAMKMQNEMKSPKAGVVVSINAAEGATVSAGDVLAVIE
ncbi:MAG TPA: biotin/lipoyl-containing protein [Pyrinomonadaceae bacterium]|nr:biotin/lipoyl-containing protein [Pyrinomonadaceae bacterium]